MHKLFSLFDGEHIPHSLHHFCQIWNINMVQNFSKWNIHNGKNAMLTCSLYKAISLFIKNFECLPDLIFNLWILEFPEMAILPTERGSWFYSYLVINQTNSLKLMSPSPSWSMTETISWNKLGQQQFKIWRGRGLGDLELLLLWIPPKSPHHLAQLLFTNTSPSIPAGTSKTPYSITYIAKNGGQKHIDFAA